MSPVLARDLQPLFVGVETQLAHAHGELDAGHACDLDGLAGRVDALCREALRVDATERPHVLERLGHIAETLSRLELRLTPTGSR